MSELFTEKGFYWKPLGGNNIDQFSGHCYQYTDIREFKTTIVVDLGKYDNYQALGVKNAIAAVPDIRDLLSDTDLMPKALFLTHSHPDHINGIVHYLKSGYKLPKLYGGRYTKMILDELLDEFNVSQNQRPAFQIIVDGDKIRIGSLDIEVLASSHTCFDSFGLIIKSADATVYHTGDMKIDRSIYFRKSTNLKRLRELSGQITHVVADFCAITEDGYAYKEVDTFKRLVSQIIKARKPKIFIPVYPTHPEMYIIAFLVALKLKKNIVFCGNRDFYTYLELVQEYGISFDELSKNRIKIVYKPERNDLDELNGDYMVIGTFNELENCFDASAEDSFGIITARSYFNPLKGQMNVRNIKYVSVQDYPELQGYGHGFLKDYEYLNFLLQSPIFLPTHCPVYVIDSFRKLADYMGIRLSDTPHNNELFRLQGNQAVKINSSPASWLAAVREKDIAYFTVVWQQPTSGEGFLKRTISRRRCENKFRIYLHQRKMKGTKYESFKI